MDTVKTVDDLPTYPVVNNMRIYVESEQKYYYFKNNLWMVDEEINEYIRKINKINNRLFRKVRVD